MVVDVRLKRQQYYVSHEESEIKGGNEELEVNFFFFY